MSNWEKQSGKIPLETFESVILPKSGKSRIEVQTGPRFGVDTAVIDLGDGRGLAVSSDPLSIIPSLGLRESAWLSAHLLINDMATTGFSPMYAQFVLNLPVTLTEKAFREYWNHLHHFCDEAGVAITGGHTGQIEGQNSTICGGGTMFLTAPLDRIITSDKARPGDVIVMTKECALASTSILAMSFPETVRNRLGNDIWQAGCENFYRTSSLQDGIVAASALEDRKGLRAMHDVTEGGVIGAIAELAAASGCGFSVDSNRIPVGEAQRNIAELFGIDPRFIVGAGSMIMAVQPGEEQELIDALGRQGIPASVVGRLNSKQQGAVVMEDGIEHPFSPMERDPYWKAFFEAMKRGWS